MPARRFCLAIAVLASMAAVGAPSASADTAATVAVFNGANQVTHPGASFARSLNAIVTDSGGSPVAGVTVAFSASTSSHGGTAQLSSATAMTNSAGLASVTAIANQITGFYPVQASVAGVTTPASFELGNVPTGYAAGDQLASISGPDENGTTQNVSSYLDSGKSYVLLDVTATWCGPSNTEAPNFTTAIAYAKAHGVNVHLVTMLMEGPTPGTPSTQSDALKWATKYKVSPVLQANNDATDALSQAGYFLQGLPAAFPTTLLISPQGKILDYVQGAQTVGALEARIMGFGAPQVNFYPPVQSYATGNDPEAVVVGDITDGQEPDIAVANFSDGNVSVLSRNATNDGYDPAQNYSVGDASTGPFGIAVGDLNNGETDVVTANNGNTAGGHPAYGWNNTITVLSTTLQNGTANLFNTSTPYTVGQGPLAVDIGDVNGDGLPDIVVANNGLVDQNTGLGNGDTISVILQNSTGTGFLPAQTYTVGNGPTGVAIGDVNGDGWPDVVVANQNDGTVSVLYGDGQGGLEPAQTLPVGAAVWSVALADINGDGKLDIVATDPNDHAVAVLMRNSANTGFDAAQLYHTTGDPYGLAIADLNGDGRPDIIASNGTTTTGQTDNTVTEFVRNASNTGFDPPTDYTVGPNPYGLAVADLNGEGKQDIVTTSLGTGGSSITTLYGAYDGGAPVTKDNVPHSWVKAPPTVTLTAIDTAGPLSGTASGVAAIHYLIGANPADPSKPANHPLTYNPAHKPVLQNGQRIAYSAIDKVGNVEPEVLSPVAHVVTDAQVKAVLSGEIAPSGDQATIKAILSHNGFTFSHFKLPAAGTANLTWSHASNGNLITVASGKLTQTTNGTGALTLRLTTTGRALLKSTSHLSVVGTSTMTMAGRSPDTVSKAFTLKS
jgi:hypothetical protein